MGRKKNPINELVEDINNGEIIKPTKGRLDEKTGLDEIVDTDKYKPEKIDIDIEIDDLSKSEEDILNKLFSAENKVYENSIKDYAEGRERMRRTLDNLEEIMNKLKEQIINGVDTPFKLFDTYSKLTDSFNALISSIDKNNKAMMKTQIDNLKDKITLLFKYVDKKTDEVADNTGDGGINKVTLQNALKEMREIEKNVDKDKGNKKNLF